ncbi:MAG: cobalt-precorrin-5B (C(1))-methyltransferase [Rhodospirillales bacterium]
MTDHHSDSPLRRGWTTGACAAAAAKAAARALLGGGFPDPVSVTLPKGQKPSFALSRQVLADGRATAGVIKDAGDDPDITDGAEVVVSVEASEPGGGVAFKAGEGVGTVTLPGLPLAVGEPAINPAPRRMIAEALRAVADEFGAAADFTVTVSIPGGERLAEKTLNGRLGIRGGLSVLGTTGVVVPYSCSAWVASIHQGVDVARATSLAHMAGATGSTSEAAVKVLHGLPEEALIGMGDFAGGLFKYLRGHPVPRLTVAGGFAKMVKLAQGHLDLHSAKSKIDFRQLAGLLEGFEAPVEAVRRARAANTAVEVLEMARGLDLPLGDMVAARVRDEALGHIGCTMAVDAVVFDRDGGLVGHAGP